MMQLTLKKRGRNRILHAFTATLVNIFLLTSFAAAEPLRKEDLGSYYVNVGLANDTFGGGIDDAFEVTIQRVRPRTLAEVDKLKAFFYAEGKDANGVDYSPGRQYIWQQEGQVYRLFKRVTGKKDVRLEVFTLTFPPTKKQQFLMRIMNSNPGLYASMNLSAKLGVLGVMGVEFRGRQGNVDFINNLQVETSAALPKAYVGNADVMLYRFALDQGYDGVSNEIDPTDWADPKVVLSREKEQFLLDNLGQFYAGKGLTDDRDDVMNKFGSAITVNGIKKEELKYIYLNCAASGDSTHGAPKSVFIPLKVQEGSNSYYPVFIFPSAFGTMNTLYAELRNAALQARWWNATANASTGDLEQKDLREALLRARVPYIAYGVAKSPTPGTTANPEYNVYVSLRSLLISAAQAALNNQEQTRYFLPWAVDHALIMAEGAGSGATVNADGFYNTLFMRFLPDITNFKAADRHITLTKKKDKDQVARNLASAIAGGYTLTAAERTQAFRAVLDSSAAHFELVEKALEKPRREGSTLEIIRTDAFELIDKLKKVDFVYDDLDWLKRLTTANLPLESLANDPIGVKLVYLADTLKNKRLKDLDVKIAAPMVIDDTLDQTTLAAMLGTATSDAGIVLQSLETSPSKARIGEIKQELEALETGLPGQYSAKAAAETAAANAIDPKKQLRDAAYTAMKTACTSGTKTFNPAPSEHDMVLYKIVWDYHYGNDTVLAACTPEVNAFVDARQEYQAVVEQQRPSVAEKAKAIEESLERTIKLKEELMRLSNGVAQTNAAIAEINSSMREKNFTWKSWIKDALTDYFLSNDGTDIAYDKLVKKLERAGVTIENRP